MNKTREIKDAIEKLIRNHLKDIPVVREEEVQETKRNLLLLMTSDGSVVASWREGLGGI